MCSVLLNDSKSRQRSGSNVSVSQLLLIVSDGRGIFLEGKEVSFILLQFILLYFILVIVFTYQSKVNLTFGIG